METILFIVEGAKEESKIVESIKRIFLGDKIVIKILYGTSVYKLYEKIREDEDFDILEILREMSAVNKEILNGVKRRDVTSVFLFFDQDCHATNASEEKLAKLINFFNNETENGKLYISYPMAEALRTIDNLEERYLQEQCFWNTVNNTQYKRYVSELTREISHISVYVNYDIKIWKILNRYNWRKANLLINNDFSLPDYKKLLGFNQSVIYEKQCKMMKIKNENNGKNIVILSAFPFFISEYLKVENIQEMLGDNK